MGQNLYYIDTGLVNAVRFDFSEDRGNAFENLVFLELQREGKEVFYHKNKRECDFLIKEGKKIRNAIQVTKSLESNREREIEDLIEALDEFDLERGVILTEDEKNEIEEKGFEIEVLPVWLWLLRNPD